MNRFLLCLASLSLSLTPASAQSTSAALAADLQAIDTAHWPAIEALLIAQRSEITAAHTASLAAASADFTAKLFTANTECQEASQKLNELQTRITTVLSTALSDLQSQLVTAQASLTAELATGDGPAAASKRLVVTDLQARIETIGSLQSAALKDDKQKALEAALAAKAAADKALADAQAALNNP